LIRPLKIGLVGFGGFGKFLHKATELTSNVRVVAVADSNETGLEADLGIPLYNSWETMISRLEVDALCIATPPSTHAEISIPAMKRGLHVLIEKPLAVTMRDARKISETAKETGRIAMVNFMQRYNPILVQLKKLHETGLFGELEHFSIHNYAQDEVLSKNHWFWDESVSGGILIEHAVHFIDIVHWFIDEPELEQVYGWQQHRSDGRRDKMGLIATYKNGCAADHFHAFTRPRFFEQTKLRLCFSLAEFDLSGWIPELGTFRILTKEEELERLKLEALFSITGIQQVDVVPIRNKNYDYNLQVTGRIDVVESKEQLYLNALVGIFNDFYDSIMQPNHTPVVGLEDGLLALEVAYLATEYCRS